MCGTQSAESASMGGTIRVLERELAEARSEVARLRLLLKAFSSADVSPQTRHAGENSLRKCGGTPSPPLASGRQ